MLLILSGCDTSGGGGGLLYVVAAVETDDSGSTSAFVMVMQGGMSGTLVADATVTVNGTALSYFLIGYVSFSDLGISAGDSVTLNVQRGGSSINATLQMPEKPVITAPAGGSQSEPVSVSWNIAANPDQFAISVDELYTASGNDYTGSESGTAGAHNIPIGTFDTGLASAYVEVTAVKETTSLGGDAEAGSVFEVGNTDESLSFNPEP